MLGQMYAQNTALNTAKKDDTQARRSLFIRHYYDENVTNIYQARKG